MTVRPAKTQADLSLRWAHSNFVGFVMRWLTLLFFQMFLHGKNLANVYDTIDVSLLPEEYLPDDYTGPCAGTAEQVIGKI